MQANQVFKDLRHNFIVNVLDGAFFGAALGFSSQVAIVPLFINSLTEATWVIGLISSFFTIGWQLPQLLTADYVAHLRRFKRTVLLLSFHERWPFLALALVTALSPALGRDVTLLLAVILLAWQALGGGFTATAWQTMISKIMPAHRRGAFYGAQSSAAQLFQSISVALAGLVLLELPSPMDFALCFLVAGIAMLISFWFLAQTREEESEPATTAPFHLRELTARLATIWRTDKNFRWFVVARSLTQFAAMATAFFTVYAVRRFDMNEGVAGAMAGIMAVSQMVGSPTFGWAGDRWGHRHSMAVGTLLAGISAFIMLAAPTSGWLYVGFAVAGFANGAFWTSVMALIADFGKPAERSYYIGLMNTLMAPAALLAPVLGGWLADTLGFGATFGLAAGAGLFGALVFQFLLRTPERHPAPMEPIGGFATEREGE